MAEPHGRASPLPLLAQLADFRETMTAMSELAE